MVKNFRRGLNVPTSPFRFNNFAHLDKLLKIGRNSENDAVDRRGFRGGKSLWGEPLSFFSLGKKIARQSQMLGEQVLTRLGLLRCVHQKYCESHSQFCKPPPRPSPPMILLVKIMPFAGEGDSNFVPNRIALPVYSGRSQRDTGILNFSQVAKIQCVCSKKAAMFQDFSWRNHFFG